MKLDPDSNDARLARHRDLFRTVHPDTLAAARAASAALTEQMQNRLLDASYLVGQAVGRLDTITGTETMRLEERYADRTGQPSYTRRKFSVKDAKYEAAIAADYLRKAWELLDPTTPPFRQLK